MSSEIHHADPRVRRAAAVGVLATIVAGALVLWWLSRWLEPAGPISTGFLDALMWGSFAATMLVCSVCVAAAAMLWAIARATLHEQRFPPAALRTVRDVPVRRGDPARRIALLCRVAASALVLLGLSVLGWLAWTLRALA